MKARDPFECWYTVAEAAQRLGVSERTAARLIEENAELLAAVRFFCGCRRLPWSAWKAWLDRQPNHEFCPREFGARTPGRELTERYIDGPVRGRTEGEARRMALQPL